MSLQLNKYTFHTSTEQDKKDIENLITTCFGKFPIILGALEHIDNKYRLAKYNNITVAMSGILPVNKSNFPGYEITWTCTLPEHRKKGLITTILEQCEADLPDDHLPIYSECWRLKGNELPNLISVMNRIGMIEIIRGELYWRHPYKKECRNCIHSKIGCECHNDLYYKER